MNFFVRVKQWLGHNRPRFVTEKSLSEMRHSFYKDFKYRFGQEFGLDIDGMQDYYDVDSFRLEYDMVRDQALKFQKTALDGSKQKHFLSSEAVTFAAIMGWATIDSIHYREQDLSQYRMIQDIVYSKIGSDPYAHGIIDRFVTYIVGTGITITIPNRKISEYVEAFIHRTEFNKRVGILSRIVFMLMSLGEFYLRVWTDRETGESYLSLLKTYQIDDFMEHPTRQGKVLAYQITTASGSFWVKDIRFDEYAASADLKKFREDWPHKEDFRKLKASLRQEYILYGKLSLFDELHGRSPLETALKDLRYYDDFRTARIILNRERSRVIWKKIIKEGSHVSNTDERYRLPPKRGLMLVSTQSVDYEAVAAKIEADEAESDGKLSLYALCAATGMPIEIMDTRGSEAVYASVKKTSNPFHQKLLFIRELLRDFVFDLIRFVLVKKLEFDGRGTLPPVVKVREEDPENFNTFDLEDKELYYTKEYPLNRLPITLDFSDTFSEDWANVAGRVKNLTEGGEGRIPIMSVTTARRKLGTTNVIEESRISVERKKAKELGYDTRDSGNPDDVTQDDINKEGIRPDGTE